MRHSLSVFFLTLTLAACSSTRAPVAYPAAARPQQSAWRLTPPAQAQAAQSAVDDAVIVNAARANAAGVPAAASGWSGKTGAYTSLVEQALQYQGTPYVWGGSSPAQGFDCSGLVQYSAKQALGLNVPRSTAQQSQFGQRVGLEEAQRGDLVFFTISHQPDSHVGILLGDGRFVHAPSSGGVVRVESLSNPYWQARFSQVRRLL